MFLNEWIFLFETLIFFNFDFWKIWFFLGFDFLTIVVASSHERSSTKQDLGFGFEQVFALQCIFSKWLDIISLRHY